MAKTLICQAIRELHIDIEPHNRKLDISPVLTPHTQGWSNSQHADTTAYLVTGTNRKGDPISLKIEDGTPYPKIVEAIKAAWRG